MFGRHTHTWKILSETTTKSKFEVACNAVYSREKVGKINIPWQMCDASRKFIQIFQCTKCGELKRFVTNI